MASWIDKVLGKGGGTPTATPEVARLLAAALEHRSGIELTESLGRAPVTMSTTIEQVRERDIIVSRPTVGGRLRPLATHAPLEMVIDLPDQRLVARTHSLGRIKITSGAGGSFYGYRLAIPARFEKHEPPTAAAVEGDGGVAIEVNLTLLDRPNAVRGTIDDLGPTGMTLRCRNARGKIQRGQKAHLKVPLPDPVGLLVERVSVVKVTEDEASGLTTVEVVFERRVESIADLLRHGGQRSLRRRAG